MNGQSDHPHVPDGLFTPHRPALPASPINIDDQVDQLIFQSPTRQLTLRDIDIVNGLQPPSLTLAQPLQLPTMSIEERFNQLQLLAEKQQKQIEEGNAFCQQAATQLQESQRQLEASQQNVTDLTAAFNNLSQQPRPLTVSSAPKKKPELPPFDSKHILIWIRRVESAYTRVGVVDPKDKFAWLESIFQVNLDPQIDAYLYGTNTAQDWEDFINYLKLRFGPTQRQKAQKLMSDIPRHDLTPSQYLVQLNEDTKDVTVDQIKREHLLKTIPPRIREIMGKEVEQMSAAEVAKAADTFFDRNGRPLEKHSASINHVAASSTLLSTLPSASSASSASTSSTLPKASSASSAPFTAAFSDNDNADVNFVRRGNGRGNNRGRSHSRNPRSNSRPPFSHPSNASSTGSSRGTSQSTHPQGTCRWHRKFGEKSLKCATDCPRFKAFQAAQKSGNGQGGRRQ